MTRGTEYRALAKTFLLVLALLLIAASQAAAQAGAHTAHAAAAHPTTVFVVRHAEKADGGADPLLSEAGVARARALIDAIGTEVHVVYTTQYQRTVLTGAPVAAKYGVEPVVVAVAGAMPAHLQKLKELVQANAGKTILIVGHSNTVPEIVKALGGPDVGPIPETDYHNLFVVTIDGNDVKVDRRKF